jgi:hypothetical protein
MKLPNLLILMLTVLMTTIEPAANSAMADEGNPVAIRRWPDGGITIETMWDLHFGTGLNDATQELISRPIDLAFVADIGRSTIVSRLPNDPSVNVIRSGHGKEKGKNDVVITHATTELLAGSFLVEVDGVKIHLIDNKAAKLISDSPDLNHAAFHMKPEDSSNTVIVLGRSFNESTTLKIAAAIQPRVIVTPVGVTKVGDQKVVGIEHNTLAVSAGDDKRGKPTRFVSLSDQPYELSPELVTLFQKKETACKESRELFASLSIEQMDFQPSNGTHTPRWNSEHMMGRELLFFSQIYHAVDPSIPVMDLNPRQMPKDYKMAHPDWTGAEEARQTERVEAFTRRYAYLLDGMPLNQKAEGSKFWTPRALLKQMERHYNEHTSNVRKKMKLDEWPKP